MLIKQCIKTHCPLNIQYALTLTRRFEQIKQHMAINLSWQKCGLKMTIRTAYYCYLPLIFVDLRQFFLFIFGVLSHGIVDRYARLGRIAKSL